MWYVLCLQQMGNPEAKEIKGCYTDLQNNTRTIATPYGANTMSIETCANLCNTYAQVWHFFHEACMSCGVT